MHRHGNGLEKDNTALLLGSSFLIWMVNKGDSISHDSWLELHLRFLSYESTSPRAGADEILVAQSHLVVLTLQRVAHGDVHLLSLPVDVMP